MKILQGIIQGSDEWKAIRAKCNTASEAPAMMGASKYMTRSELLKQKATGIIQEVDAPTQCRFNDGHAAEEAARPIAEEIIGQELYPATATNDAGDLLASFDGITMGEDIVWEHKLWSESLAESVRQKNLDPHYYWQLEQQILVSGADSALFMVSNGTKEKCVWMMYEPVAGRAEKLIAGWQQFDADLKAYKPVEAATEVVGHAPESLPALRIEVTGMVTASNLAEFKERALAVIHGVNTNLRTDNDFADAEKAVKWCKDVEERLDGAKQHALSQTATIDDLFRTVDAIKEEARTVRLKLEKLVKSEKENRKAEIISKAKAELQSHVDALHKRIGVHCISFDVMAFPDAIKGLKSLESMRDRVSVALANAKIETSQIADRIEANRKTVEDMSLFPDFAAVCAKAPEDFAALIALRIAQRQERMDAERARIRAEEATKLAAESAKSMAEEKPVENPKQAPVAIKKGRMTAEEMRARINRCLDDLNDHQLLNVLAYIEGHFIAHAA